jgi:hypothetical protein
MRDALSRPGVSPVVSCDDPEFDACLLDAKGTSILAVVNHRPESAAGSVRVHKLTHAVEYACDLSTGKEIPFWKVHQEAIRLHVPLTPRQGILIGLLPERPSGWSLKARQEENELVVELGSGCACPLPVFIEARDPRGWKHIRHSRALVLRGRAVIRSPLAVNEREGEWKIEARCPAAGWNETAPMYLSRR